jgi:IMP dehydrogenase/GMP reductase
MRSIEQALTFDDVLLVPLTRMYFQKMSHLKHS